MMEIFVTMKKFYSVPIKNCYETSGVIMSLFRED